MTWNCAAPHHHVVSAGLPEVDKMCGAMQPRVACRVLQTFPFAARLGRCLSAVVLCIGIGGWWFEEEPMIRLSLERNEAVGDWRVRW